MTWFIILAAGNSKRFNNKENKLFKTLKNKKPLFLNVINTCNKIQNSQVVLVYNKTYYKQFKGLVKNNILLVEGDNKIRQKSLINAVTFIKHQLKPKDIIVTLDADRPLVSLEIIKKAISVANKYGYSSAYIPLDDSIIYKDKKNLKYLDRSKCYLIQTPQCFQCKYWKTTQINNTDLFSSLNLKLTQKNLFLGSKINLKITTKEDYNLLKNY